MSESASGRIKRHAGIGISATDNARTVSAATGRRDADEIAAAAVDLVAALAAFNHELNGPSPSAETGAQADDVEREVVSAIAESARMLREADAVQCAEDVESAWLAVLAGDIDDVGEHVASERRMRAGR
jgi:hypothetical protein